MTVNSNLLASELDGHLIKLIPIEEKHRHQLAEAAGDARIWRNTPLGPSFDHYFESLLDLKAGGTQVPFAVYHKSSDRLIGGTRFMDIVAPHCRLEIGGTWYHPDYWGGPTNPEAKWLLLNHAFGRFAANRVQLLTDVLNTHSQAAIAKLGAQREGVLRSHMIVDNGRIRDSVSFSITKQDWPGVDQKLRARLAEFGVPTD